MADTDKEEPELAAKLEQLDVTDADASTDATEESSAEPKTAVGMVKAMAKLGGANMLSDARQTYSNADGKVMKGDRMHAAADMEGALASLKQLCEEAQGKAKEKKKAIWDFRTSPHEHFGKTLDDTFKAFLMWGRVTEEDDDEAAAAGANGPMINVSKAFRRLESYAEWMEETGEDLTSPPLTASSVEVALRQWEMKTSYDKEGRLVWWIDMAAMDFKKCKHIPAEASLRAFVWFAHAIMFDEAAQQKGMAFVENLACCTFWQTMTLMPMKLSMKLDRLTIGVIPVKMKLLVMLDCPTWMNVMMKIFGVFLSKKMKSRMVALKKDWDVPAQRFGLAAVPKDWGGCQSATLTADPVLDKYMK